MSRPALTAHNGFEGVSSPTLCSSQRLGVRRAMRRAPWLDQPVGNRRRGGIAVANVRFPALRTFNAITNVTKLKLVQVQSAPQSGCAPKSREWIRCLHHWRRQAPRRHSRPPANPRIESGPRGRSKKVGTRYSQFLAKKHARTPFRSYA